MTPTAAASAMPDRQYHYDTAGRPITFTGNGHNASYLYDGFGERVRKIVDGTPTHFTYDEAGHLIGEYTASTQTETIYLDDQPLLLLRDGAVYYVHADWRNTPRQLDNAQQQAVWRWTPAPFGETAAVEDPSQLGSNFTWNSRYPGQYYDAESGLLYNVQRTYDPAVGRYLESDPIGLNGGINTYVYVGGNPVSYTDPFGLCPPGTHTATLDEISKITTAATDLARKGLKYSDIQCNQYVDRSINNAFPGALSQEYNTSQMRNGEGPFQKVVSPSVGNLALLSSPGHVVYITGVKNGAVSQFLGSQTSTGPATVNLPHPYYWSPKFDKPGNVIYLQICLPN